MTHRVEEVMHAAGYAQRPHAVVCFARDRPRLAATDDRVLLTDVSRVADTLAARPACCPPPTSPS
jgi:hypothetical protein